KCRSRSSNPRRAWSNRASRVREQISAPLLAPKLFLMLTSESLGWDRVNQSHQNRATPKRSFFQANHESAFAHDEACYSPPRENARPLTPPENSIDCRHDFIRSDRNVHGGSEEPTCFGFVFSALRSASTDPFATKPPARPSIYQWQAGPAWRRQRRADQCHRAEAPRAFWTDWYSWEFDSAGAAAD